MFVVDIFSALAGMSGWQKVLMTDSETEAVRHGELMHARGYRVEVWNTVTDTIVFSG